MLRKIVMLGAISLAVPAAADSGQLDSTSSGTMTFQVYIPPIAASLRAAEKGAAGIWTVKGRDRGLMIGFNQQNEGFGSVTLFSRPSMGVALSWGLPGENSDPIAMTNTGGLNQSTYDVPDGSMPVRTFFVSGI